MAKRDLHVRLKVLVVSTVVWLLPLLGWTLNLGEIQLRSFLSQPLEADIPLINATTEELDTLQVSLATQDIFEQYGLARSPFLSNLQFEIVSNQSNQDILRITSENIMVEDSMTILLAFSWLGEQLIEEYNLQLQSDQSGEIYGPVNRGDTLWSLAELHLPPGIIVNQMMLAMYLANPNAFNGNINFMLEGSMLEIPGYAEANLVDPNEATEEAIRQNQEWSGLVGEGQFGLRLVPANSDTVAMTELEVQNTSLQAELEEARRLIEVQNSEIAELQVLLSTMEEIAATDAVQEEIIQPGNETDPASSSADSGTQQTTFLSRLINFLSSPFLLMGLGLGVLTATATWYLKHRNQVGNNSVRSWETLENQLKNDEVTSNESEESKLSESEITDVGMKLNLGRAYIDMRDEESARKVLEEVIEEGDSIQREEAKALLVALLLK